MFCKAKMRTRLQESNRKSNKKGYRIFSHNMLIYNILYIYIYFCNFVTLKIYILIKYMI